MHIPYKCRCEAIGENRRLGERYKCLNGLWRKDGEFIFSRSFDLPACFKGLLVFFNCGMEKRPDFRLWLNGAEVEITGESFEITEYVRWGENDIAVELLSGHESAFQSFLLNMFLTARPLKHINNFSVEGSLSEDFFELDVFVSLGGRMTLGVSPEISAELYDADYELVTASSVGKGSYGSCAKVTLRLEKQTVNEAAEKGYFTLLLLCSGEVLRKNLCVDFSCEGEILLFDETHDNIKRALENYQKEEAKRALAAEPVPTVCERAFSGDMPDITVSLKNDTENVIAVKGENFLYEFDLNKGAFESLLTDGIKMPLLSFDKEFRLMGAEKKYAVLSASHKSEDTGYSAMVFVFGNGEISCSVSCFGNAQANCNAPCSAFIKAQEAFGGFCFAGDTLKNARWALFYDNHGRGFLLKGIEDFNLSFVKDRDATIMPTDGSVFSFAARPVFIADEDIAREAKTLPAVTNPFT